MNILCPNCQKTLTVPEESAGQMMQCPLCQGTFTMPALAAGPSAPPTIPATPHETFSLASPPSEVHRSDKSAPSKKPAPPRDKDGAAPIMDDLVLPTIAGEYRHALPIKVSRRFVRWLVPVCLILIFLLSFFPWVGSYPGGYGLFTQNGWQAAFGGWGHLADADKVTEGRLDKDKDAPGASGLLIFYMIFVCLLFLASVAFILFHLLPQIQAPIVKLLVPLQGLILGGGALLIFLFLGIEMLKGFNLVNQIHGRIDNSINTNKEMIEKSMGKSGVGIARGMAQGSMSLRATLWFRLVVLLNLLAIIGGALELWLGRRGNKPPPKLEFAW